MIKKLLLILFLTVSSIVFSQEKSIENLSAAPNPFTYSTKISFQSTNNLSTNFSVKNILGNTVYSENLKTHIGNNLIPFSKGDLKPGMYIYSIQNKNNIISKRFVIK